MATDDRHSGARIRAIRIAGLDQWPSLLDLRATRFGLFLACDATGQTHDDLSAVAEQALASGAVYVVVWGPGCERVHDAFDDVHVMRRLDDPTRPEIMTTWHARESLDEALWFFACVAVARPENGLAAGVAVAVGRDDWHDQIRARLADLPRLVAAVLSSDT